MAGFLWNDVVFEPLPSGDVKVWKPMFRGGPPLFEIVVPGADWCRIVTACSAHPSPETHAVIAKLHLRR